LADHVRESIQFGDHSMPPRVRQSSEMNTGSCFTSILAPQKFRLTLYPRRAAIGPVADIVWQASGRSRWVLLSHPGATNSGHSDHPLHKTRTAQQDEMGRFACFVRGFPVAPVNSERQIK
jgi:hypothetical protein